MMSDAKVLICLGGAQAHIFLKHNDVHIMATFTVSSRNWLKLPGRSQLPWLLSSITHRRTRAFAKIARLGI